MHRRRGLLAGVVGVISIALVLSLVGGAAVGKKKRKTVKLAAPNMNGQVEVPPGDPDGSGEAKLRLKKKKKRVCYTISFQGIEDPFAGHIHKGAEGVAGPIVVPLFEDATGAPSPISDCVSAKKKLIKRIGKKPRRFYVNIHNDDFPDGALRDQLQKKRRGDGGSGGGGGDGAPY